MAVEEIKENDIWVKSWQSMDDYYFKIQKLLIRT
jgi:hypothetical protein